MSNGKIKTANFTNCSFVGYEDDANSIKMYGVWMYNGDANYTNCTFTGTRGMKICDKYASEIGTVIIDGCRFIGLTQKPGVAIDDCDTQDMKITIKNSTFIQCQPGDQGFYIYETDNTVPTVVDNTINHTGNTAAIKAFQVESIENIIINVTETAGKTKGGIVVQEGNDKYIGSLKNVTITGATTFVGGTYDIKVTLQEEITCTINGVVQTAPCAIYIKK